MGFQFTLAARVDQIPDGPTQLVIRPSVEAPIWFILGKIARIETGLGFSVSQPANDLGYLELAGSSSDPAIASPGIPLGIVLQPFTVFYLGASTGFGMRKAQAGMSAQELQNGVFIPLGFQLGGTIPVDGHPVADITTHADFPYAFLGREPGKFKNNVWRLGADVRILAEL